MTPIDQKQQHQFSENDKKFMKLALKLAQKAELKGEVPVGAVLVDPQGQIIAQAGNVRESQNTALGHAELACLHRAGTKLKSWRLIDCTLYVTLEPCFMCAAAIAQARLKRVVFGAPDPKGGALGSVVNYSQDSRLHHRFEVHNGLLAQECSDILKNFFKRRRKKLKT